jgi:LPXTG-motif cell wall-anchored protein
MFSRNEVRAGILLSLCFLLLLPVFLCDASAGNGTVSEDSVGPSVGGEAFTIGRTHTGPGINLAGYWFPLVGILLLVSGIFGFIKSRKNSRYS